MRFGEYMVSRDLKDEGMASLIGCDRSYVVKLRNGRVPSPEMIRHIANVTENAVQFDDWLPREEAA